MDLKQLQRNIAELVSVAPQSFSTDAEAAEAAAWVLIEKKAETEVEELLGPPIKSAFDIHKTLTTKRKQLLENLIAAKEKVRVQLATWIAAGNSVDGCSIRTKYKVTVEDAGLLPAEYLMMVPDLESIQKHIEEMDNTVAIPGIKVNTIHTLYAQETANDRLSN